MAGPPLQPAPAWPGQGIQWQKRPGTHLVTDELPLLLVVILAQQLDLVRGQVHAVLGGGGQDTDPEPGAQQEGREHGHFQGTH